MRYWSTNLTVTIRYDTQRHDNVTCAKGVQLSIQKAETFLFLPHFYCHFFSFQRFYYKNVNNFLNQKLF